MGRWVGGWVGCPATGWKEPGKAGHQWACLGHSCQPPSAPLAHSPSHTLIPPLPFRSNFANHNKLKRQAMKVIAAAMPADEIAGLAEIFKSIDADGSGTITAEELRDALNKKGSLLKAEDLQGLLALIDQDQSGCIDYEVGLGWA